MFRPNISNLAFLFGVAAPLLVSAGVAAYLFRDQLSEFFATPQPSVQETFVISGDGREVTYSTEDIRFRVPERWHTEDLQRYGVSLKPDFKDTACEMRVGFGPNTVGGNAGTYLEEFDLGPRVGQDVYQDEKWQGIIDVSGRQAAAFWWKAKDLIRYREVYVPRGAQLMTVFGYENLNKLKDAGTNCFEDFDTLVNTITL